MSADVHLAFLWSTPERITRCATVGHLEAHLCSPTFLGFGIDLRSIAPTAGDGSA
jgi:hypothetical protein